MYKWANTNFKCKWLMMKRGTLLILGNVGNERRNHIQSPPGETGGGGTIGFLAVCPSVRLSEYMNLS